MRTVLLPSAPDRRSPAGADVRLLLGDVRGGIIHSTVPPHQINRAMVHATVSELWYVMAGRGEIWRRNTSESSVTVLRPGTAVDIPVGTEFQYRNTSDADLVFLCVTMPPWPGASEATQVPGVWDPTV
jgi:mannose-6-phosphate isomerase-like protein (cupin superfamily)